MNNSNFKYLIVMLSILLLQACGGGGNEDKPATADTTAPTAPSIARIVSDNAGRITVEGIAEANSNVTVRFPDGSSQNTTAGSNGAYSLTSTQPQGSGDVRVSATDAASNSSPLTTQSYTQPDRTAPAAPSITSIAPDNAGRITVEGIAEANSTVTVKFPDGSSQNTTSGSNGAYSVTSTQPQGSGDVKVSAMDAAGNISQIATEKFNFPLQVKTFKLDVKEINFTRSGSGQQLNADGKTFNGNLVEIK